MQNILLFASVLMIVGCCQLRDSTPNPAVRAEIAIIRQSEAAGQLPDLRLTLRNVGRERVFVPQWRGDYFGKVILECQGKLIELRHKNLWEPLLTGLLVPETKLLMPGERLSYNLAVSTEFPSLEDLKKQKAAKSQGVEVSPNAATLEALAVCRKYEIRCVVDRLEVVSNSIKVTVRCSATGGGF